MDQDQFDDANVDAPAGSTALGVAIGEGEPFVNDPADESLTDEVDGDAKKGILDRLRGSGVGTEDPNIIGDAGPFDVAPGTDPT